MGTLKEEILFFSTLNKTVQNNVRSTLDAETTALRNRIKKRSPSSSGRYKNAWRVNKTRGTGVIASSQVLNPSVQASALEFGISPQNTNHSWVVAHGRKSPSLTKKSVSAVGGGTRIWSSKAIGGSMMIEFSNKYKKELTKTIADSVIQAFK